MNDIQQKLKAIIICGPTGIGKTSVAIRLSQKFHGEIVNADSMQIYRYMDIGSAKPTEEEQQAVRHHLIDIVNPDEPFDAGKFSQMAYDTIKNLHENQIFPFVVGGTGLYIKAMLHGLFRDRPCNADTLSRLKKEADTHGAPFLHDKLKTCDLDSASKIHPNDTFRIIRALEVFMETGKPISSFHQAHGFPEGLIHAKKIGLNMDRKVLYERINMRVDMMIKDGLVEEVKNLIKKGYPKELKPMKSIGYRHVTEYLNQKISWDDMLFLFKRDTRRYAKRQLTWFRNDPDILWFQPSEIGHIENVVDQFIEA
ncbi:MAG: tRNA (adenosine(37)-N6)-dimethylallyltransferase MiaA [Proteobacteria bacterium]|nr:tRNA (adenosine(37)-N6)-dimethylallyltransferase MiaA [Pseudomonadota bacterium]